MTLVHGYIEIVAVLSSIINYRKEDSVKFRRNSTLFTWNLTKLSCLGIPMNRMCERDLTPTQLLNNKYDYIYKYSTLHSLYFYFTDASSLESSPHIYVFICFPECIEPANYIKKFWRFQDKEFYSSTACDFSVEN